MTETSAHNTVTKSRGRKKGNRANHLIYIIYIYYIYVLSLFLPDLWIMSAAFVSFARGQLVSPIILLSLLATPPLPPDTRREGKTGKKLCH
jgi:hypothetical protein